MTARGAPWIPDGVEPDGTLVSSQREIQLDDSGGSHSGHVIALHEDLGNSRWRGICSCGEPVTVREAP